MASSEGGKQTVHRRNTGTILGLCIVQKSTRLHSQTHSIPSVLGCVFHSIFMVSIVVCVAELRWFSIHAFHGLEQGRPWPLGLDTSNKHT